MNGKAVCVLAICAAVIAASVAGVVVTNNRAAIARAKVAKAESDEARAASEAKRARAEEAAEASKAAAAASMENAERDKRIAKEAEEEAERLALRRAKEEKVKSANDAAAAKDRAKEAADRLAAETARSDARKAEADKVIAMADAEKRIAEANAQAEADSLAAEHLRSDAQIAERDLLQLRMLDFEAIKRDLDEYRQELDERERALRPEMTAADLTWVGEREADTIGAETNAARRSSRPLPEDDMSLPRGTRALAKAERLAAENEAVRNAAARENIVTTLERLYIEALREDRAVDAQFYRKSIKSFYPDWEFSVKEENENKEEENK